MGQNMVNAALRVRLGRGPQGEGVRNVRSVTVAASLAALFVVSQTTISVAASSDHRINASYSAYSSHASAPMSSRAEEPVPANCIRQSCGKLWCWQMNGSKGSH